MNKESKENMKSMDEIDRLSFNSKNTHFAGNLQSIALEKKAIQNPGMEEGILLDGEWELIEAGRQWEEAMAAAVPGSIHTALVRAGRIPDTNIGANQKIAKEQSFKPWTYRKKFLMSTKKDNMYRLEFDGICNRCTIWFNGHELGRHEGMFGGPEYDVTDLIEKENELIVELEAIPVKINKKFFVHPENNNSWFDTVVINNVYGWHYSNMPSLGIWRSVRIVAVPKFELINPFVATKSISPATVMASVEIKSQNYEINGILEAQISPFNFEGEICSFACPVRSDLSKFTFKAEFIMNEAKLWWPVDLGEPNLYKIEFIYKPSSDEPASKCETIFGIRTIEMDPFPEGPNPDTYNWIFIVNSKKIFAKGTGWCTSDAMLDFSKEKLRRFISLASKQHCQILRAWGSGMPETDEFYDLCDEYGVMVLQEWPTAWNSHNIQPYDILEDTVCRNTLRLRNHPSLVMWGAGNESPDPFGKAIDMMGRLSIELDGTRPFHRGEPWGGSTHNYECYWGYEPLDYNLNLTAKFFGEFGLASMPDYESVMRYMPQKDIKKWPLFENETIKYHTPTFGYKDDVGRLEQYAHFFIDENATLKEMTIGSQLSQAVGLRHPLELARTRWPECAGALYYKLNDNFPAASWSTIDWYGAPKISHYFCQDAFSPLAAIVLFKSVNSYGISLELPVYLADDADALKDKDWEASVKIYDSNLMLVENEKFEGNGSVDSPNRLGTIKLDADKTRSAPLFFVSEVKTENNVVHRNFYFINYEYDKGCLFRLPRTSLKWEADEAASAIIVSNDGNKPAVAVHVLCPGKLNEFEVSDNYFWLESGERKTLRVNFCRNISVEAWNSI